MLGRRRALHLGNVIGGSSPLHVVTIVQIIVPLVSDEVHLKVQVPVAQEWIVGKVPETVVTGGNLMPVTIAIGGGPSGSGSTVVKTGSKEESATTANVILLDASRPDGGGGAYGDLPDGRSGVDDRRRRDRQGRR